MLICFGAAWPFSVYKSFKTKRVDGKSPLFMFIIFLGYVSGILHKLFYSFDRVIYLYFFNGLMVALDLFLYFLIKYQKVKPGF